jgi:hypothetical protein
MRPPPFILIHNGLMCYKALVCLANVIVRKFLVTLARTPSLTTFGALATST